MGLLKTVLENSECHTLDRYNMRAQRDICGLGNTDSSKVDSAITALFNLNHYPLVQNYDIRDCIENFFEDSLQNIQKDHAKKLSLGMISLSIVMLLISFVY